MEFGGQLISAVLAGDGDQRNSILQHLQPIAVLLLQVIETGCGFTTLQQPGGATLDAGLITAAELDDGDGVVVQAGKGALIVIETICLFGEDGLGPQLAGPEIAQEMLEPLLQRLARFRGIEEPGFDEGDAGHGEVSFRAWLRQRPGGSRPGDVETGGWRSEEAGPGNLGGSDPCPVDAAEQRLELDPGQRDRPRLRLRPGEPGALHALHHQHQAGAVPDQQLQPVGAARAKNVYRAGERIEVEMVGDMRRQSVHALAEIDRLGGEVDSETAEGVHHCTAPTARRTSAR